MSTFYNHVRIKNLPLDKPYYSIPIIIDINGSNYEVCADLSDNITQGEEIQAEFIAFGESYETIPSCSGKKEIISNGSWSYIISGEVVCISDSQTILDCGDFYISVGWLTKDAKVLGKYIRLNIDRLDLIQAPIP